MATVFVVDDDQGIRELVADIIESLGHGVLEADTLQEALRKIPEVKELGVSVVILDGSLSPRSDNDGEYIATALRNEIPGVKIVSFSAVPRAWGDMNLLKPSCYAVLRSTIQQLLQSP